MNRSEQTDGTGRGEALSKHCPELHCRVGTGEGGGGGADSSSQRGLVAEPGPLDGAILLGQI